MSLMMQPGCHCDNILLGNTPHGLFTFGEKGQKFCSTLISIFALSEFSLVQRLEAGGKC